MRVIVLQGSPNRKGLTALLCGELEHGAGCGTPSATSRSRFVRRAYELGRSL